MLSMPGHSAWRPATFEGGEPDAVLAFDIETSVDRNLVPPDWDEGRFPKPAWHRIEAISVVEASIVHDAADGPVYQVEAVRSGGASGWPERRLLAAFWTHLASRSWRLASFNGGRFDLGVLVARSLIHGLEAGILWRRGSRWAHYLSRYDATWHVDLLQVLSLNGAATAHSLEEVARATGWPGKAGEHGSAVDEMIARGERERVRRYCECDASQTMGVLLSWMRLTGAMSAAAHDRSLETLLRVLEADPKGRPHLAALAKHRRDWGTDTRARTAGTVAVPPDGHVPASVCPNVIAAVGREARG